MGLLVITECGGPPPPPDHQSWFWVRVRLYIIMVHHGWATARETGMDRLGIGEGAHIAPP